MTSKDKKLVKGLIKAAEDLLIGITNSPGYEMPAKMRTLAINISQVKKLVAKKRGVK